MGLFMCLGRSVAVERVASLTAVAILRIKDAFWSLESEGLFANLKTRFDTSVFDFQEAVEAV